MAYNENKLIGRVIATEKCPTTIDNFTFWTSSELILNPFDIVKVEHVDGSYSYGQIEDISHITDANSFLTNFISSDFGDVNVDDNTLRIGMNYVSAKVICNTKNIYIPLISNSKVMLAAENEINNALGLNGIKNPLVCGYLEMYKGNKECEQVTLPVHLDSRFVIGPEGAHLNISGISGLAAKTSYAMFLLKAIQDMCIKEETDDDGGIAFVLFNVKGKDLLAIDEINDYSDEDNPAKAKQELIDIYKKLNLSPEPFKHVKYYYPKSSARATRLATYLDVNSVKDRKAKGEAKEFVYLYPNDKDSIDLLFANIDDGTQTMDSIITYITQGQGEFQNVQTWQGFLDEVKERYESSKPVSDKEISKASWRKFARIVNKSIRGNAMFVDREDGDDVRLGDALRKIKKNEVHVIDIAKLSEDKQAFVFGDAIRTICNLQLEGPMPEEKDVNPPDKIIIFIDELNKYASKETPKNSPILRQILDVAERGRSLGIVLFAAEQFRSAIHDRVTGNCSTHAYGRTNAIETAKGDYSSVPKVYKNIMTRLTQGEYIIQNPILRSFLSIKFPKPIYKQFKS